MDENVKRYKKVHTKGERKALRDFHNWIREQPSCISGEDRDIQVCHVRTWQRTGEHWYNVVPMTAFEHRCMHDSGAKTFQRVHCIDLENEAIIMTDKFIESKGFSSLEEMLGSYDE